MLDQGFNADNFRRIFDNENRKGNDLVNHFFHPLRARTFAIKEEVTKLRAIRSAKNSRTEPEFTALEASLRETLRHLKNCKSREIEGELEELSARIASSGFSLSLEKRSGPEGKAIYCVDNSAEAFFVIKQLQHNLNRIYGVKQSNRHELLCQLRETLGSNFPFQIVRTDIKSFYETIDSSRLLKKLDEDQLLSFTSKRFINQIIKCYQAESDSELGLPRGVGISSYLSEMYLRQVDSKIRLLEGVVLYCRYVDDILAVFARPPHHPMHISYKEQIVQALEDEGLTHNPEKTVEFDLSTQPNFCFDYLGYQFRNSTSNSRYPKITPSKKKLEKLKMRLQLSFDEYFSQRNYHSRSAFRVLVARVKFLTGNTRLLNSKSNARTGIYFNNYLVNVESAFDSLDVELSRLTASTENIKLQRRFSGISFKAGFRERRFHEFSFKQFEEIVRVWKHA